MPKQGSHGNAVHHEPDRVKNMHNRVSAKSVLIIDDNPVACIFVASYFKIRGYAVLVSDTGVHGYEMAWDKFPDLILVQGKLPDINGMTVIQRIQGNRLTRDIPVIFYTGSHKEKMRYKLNPPENTYYLHTPWDAPRLHEIVCEEICLEEPEITVPEHRAQTGYRELKRKAQC